MNPHIFAQLAFVIGVGLPLSSNPIAFAADPPGTLCTKAGQYCINRETSSGRCSVQEATEVQTYGPNLAGPYPTRAEATEAMCKTYYDPATEDENKCAAVVPTNACDNVK